MQNQNQYEYENPELKYAQKFERFENNPYASDGWDDVARENFEYVQENFSKEEQIAVEKSLEEENLAGEITQDEVMEAFKEYDLARERDARRQRDYVEDAVALSQIQDYVAKGYDKSDPIFFRKELEDYRVERGERLGGVDSLEVGDKVIGRYGEFREANDIEIAESQRLSKLSENIDDESQFRSKEKFIAAMEDRADRMESIDQENSRIESPVYQMVDAIPIIRDIQQEVHGDRVVELHTPTNAEREVYGDEYIEGRVDSQIHSGDWHDIEVA